MNAPLRRRMSVEQFLAWEALEDTRWEFDGAGPVAASATVLSEPVIVFEVLSSGTENTDLTIKNAEYRATPSIRRYVVLQRDAPGALMVSRKGDDWVAEAVSGDGGVLRLPEIDITLPLAELYADLPPPAAAEPVAS